MIEKKEITKKLIKNMLINFIIFTLVLITFNLIIYNNIIASLYKDVDLQLENVLQGEGREKIDGANIEPEKNDYEIGQIELENMKDDILSPRLIVIERDEDANILNESDLGMINNYIDVITFNQNSLGVIYNIKINNEYAYRGINYKVIKENDEVVYLQVLVNVDGEARNSRKFG